MRYIPCIFALAASSRAFTFVPVHGCEWVPETTPVTNFTLSSTSSSSSSSSSDYKTLYSAQWKVPTLGVSCSSAAPSSSGSRIPLRCTAPASSPTDATLVLQSVPAPGDTNSTATLSFLVYEQCAADIFEFGYEAQVALACTQDGDAASTVCVPSGNSTAKVVRAVYLPPIRPPPPPPYGGW